MQEIIKASQLSKSYGSLPAIKNISLTTGLDAKARREVWKILSSLKEKGMTIFLTSHFMDEIEALCDCICILKKGEIVFYGTVSQAIEKSPFEKFEDAYLWFTEKEEQNIENI